MITPQFSVSQDEEYVHIEIRAPYIKAANVEFHVDGPQFIFSLHPYYLRLNFPGNLVQDEEIYRTSYDLATSTIHAYIPKETKGEHFPDLEMLTKLLANSKANASSTGLGMDGLSQDTKKPLIQELDNDNSNGDNAIEKTLEESTYPELNIDDENFSWEFPQSVQLDDPILGKVTGFKYGFDEQYTGLIGASVLQGNDINELDDPEHTSPEKRTEARVVKINEKFDPDYYLADLHDNPYIDELIAYKLPTGSELTSEDKETMLKLSSKHYLLDHPKPVYMALISLLYGVLYDCRTTMSDPTVESPWTIAKLCPQMSFLDNNFKNVRDLLKTSVSLALSYPLYRRWNLSLVVITDVLDVLKLGRQAILHQLLKAYRLFNSEQHQVYNTILLEDYIVWLQMDAKDLVIQSLVTEVEKVRAQGFNLAEFELGGYSLQELHTIESTDVMEQADSDDED